MNSLVLEKQELETEGAISTTELTPASSTIDDRPLTETGVTTNRPVFYRLGAFVHDRDIRNMDLSNTYVDCQEFGYQKISDILTDRSLYGIRCASGIHPDLLVFDSTTIFSHDPIEQERIVTAINERIDRDRKNLEALRGSPSPTAEEQLKSPSYVGQNKNLVLEGAELAEAIESLPETQQQVLLESIVQSSGELPQVSEEQSPPATLGERLKAVLFRSEEEARAVRPRLSLEELIEQGHLQFVPPEVPWFAKEGKDQDKS